MATTYAMTDFAAIAPEADSAPLYRLVKRALLRVIEAARYPAGGVLPNETDLAAAFGVSIGTLRHAVDELVAEHILVRRQGRGTFVALHNADRFMFQFFHVERSDGTALTFGDKPVEYRVSTINTARHDYVQMLTRPT